MVHLLVWGLPSQKYGECYFNYGFRAKKSQVFRSRENEVKVKMLLAARESLLRGLELFQGKLRRETGPESHRLHAPWAAH